jgi:hypothetical protein
MRVSDDRYSRDRQRLDVALHFIRLEARTHTIRAWTGLSDDRIRKLYRSYLCDPRHARLTRHRGKSPQQTGFFLRTARARQEAALLASLYQLLGALPDTRSATPGAALPSLTRAELLYQSYEIYQGLIPSPLISFEHAVFLLNTLLRADELVLGACRDCGAALIVDRWSLRSPRCALCLADPALENGPPAMAGLAPEGEPRAAP